MKDILKKKIDNLQSYELLEKQGERRFKRRGVKSEIGFDTIRMTHFCPDDFKKSVQTKTTDDTIRHQRVKSYVNFKKMLGRGK